ncbi:MAG: phytanoyl-CoA dioxygenase family protein [Dehalococcoidia bacterium]|nr:phytanoyl-CoA dioxygenase family protein [Dehalococcoidia bacterium]
MSTSNARMTAASGADDVAAALAGDGYAIVEGLLSRDDARAKRAELTRILDATPVGRNDFEGFHTRRIYALFAKTRVFDRPATDPLVLGVLDRVLGGSYQLSAPVGIEIAPGETAQPLHTDDGIYPIARPHPEIVLNTMWALDDFTEENGATRVVPGSQNSTQRPPEDAPVEIATMPAGSVMFFVGSVYHGGGANNSDRPRLGTILHYCAGWLRPQENHILGVPRELMRTLDPRLQELLGYNIHPPFVGNVDGRHPRKWLEDRR